MPAGEQAVDGAQAALGRDDEARPAFAGARRCRPASATVSSARTTVVPTAITRPPQPCTALTSRAVVSGHAVALGVRRLAELGRGDAGVQRQRRDEDAARDELGDELGA